MKQVKFDDAAASIVDSVRKDFETRREARRSMETQWRLNLNYIIGNQYCEIAHNGDIEDYGKQYFWQQREVYNHTATVLETRISKLNGIKLGMSVRPATNDESDKSAALFASQILQSVFNEKDFQLLVNEANMWSESTGTAFYKVSWNKQKGRPLGATKKGIVYEGDVDIKVCPPFEIYPDNLTANHIDDCKSIMQVKAYSVDEIKNIWGVDVSPEDVNGFAQTGNASIGGLGYTGYVQSMANRTLDNHALVIELYEAADTLHPDGRLVIVAGDKLVYDGVLPYVNAAEGKRGFPFIKQTSVMVPGSFFGTSIVERMIPIQRAYNAVKNRKHEYMNRMTMGVLAVEDGSIDVDNLEEEGLSPGKVLVFRQGSHIPTMLETGSVPIELVREEERLLSEFTVISGVSDLMKYSQAPDSNSSGKAISLLMQQDESRLGMTAQEIRSAVKAVAQHVLRLLKQFAVAKRLERIAGDNGEIQLKYFNKSDISSDDIVFDCSGDILESSMERRNMVLNLLQLGILNDENGKMSASNKNKVLEMLGFGNWESALELDELHIKKAQKENEKLLTESVECDEIDDAELHIRQHTKALLGGEYNYSDEAKQRVMEHIREHKKIAALNAQAIKVNAAE